MTLGLVRHEERSLIHQFTMRITLRCTPTQSVLSRFRCGDTSGSTRNYPESKSGMSLEHSRQTCLLHQQTGTAHHTQQTDTDQSATSDVQHKQGEKQQREDSRTGIRQRTGRETTSTDIGHEEARSHLSICACHPPHCLPINRQITQQVTVIGINGLSQHRHLNTPA